MNKKIMLLALSVASAAMLAIPALAVALPAHLSATSNFTVSGGTSVLTETEGSGTHSTSLTGSGAFTTTTTGTLSLTFHGVTAGHSPSGISCGSTAQGHTEASRVVTTTPLTFHLIMVATHRPAILITPNHDTKVFAHKRCFGVEKTITGTGLIGEIISPTCGTSSTTAKLRITGSNGHQALNTYTGVTYNLHTNSGATASLNMPVDATITFPAARSITCTH